VMTHGRMHRQGFGTHRQRALEAAFFSDDICRSKIAICFFRATERAFIFSSFPSWTSEKHTSPVPKTGLQIIKKITLALIQIFTGIYLLHYIGVHFFYGLVCIGLHLLFLEDFGAELGL